MKIAIVNGPNLNMVGIREPEIYGHQNLVTYLKSLSNEIPEIDFETFQSNIEGELIDFLQKVDCDVIILNAGAFTHTSVAIGDTVAAISTPVIELHISNVYKRESFRTHSYVAPHARGIITGFGIGGYKIAVGAALAL